MRELPNAATFPDRGSMVLEWRFQQPVERLWRAISDPAELKHWFMKTELEPRAGGRFSFEGGWDGRIGEWTPGACIRFDADEGGSSRFELEATDEGPAPATRLRIHDRLPEGFTLDPPADDVGALLKLMVAQPGGPGTHWPGVVAGWHGFLDALEAHLEQRPYDDRYPALCEAYNEILRERYGSESPESE